MGTASSLSLARPSSGMKAQKTLRTPPGFDLTLIDSRLIVAIHAEPCDGQIGARTLRRPARPRIETPCCGATAAHDDDRARLALAASGRLERTRPVFVAAFYGHVAASGILVQFASRDDRM
jgi:hypothetical protein